MSARDDFERSRTQADEALGAAGQERTDAERDARIAENERSEADEALREATDVAARTQARAEALARALEEMSGAGGKAIIGNLEGVLGAFLDLIEIDAGWDRAVESAAGASVGAMVVDGRRSARAALEAVSRMPDRIEAHLALGVVESALGANEEAAKGFSDWVAGAPSFFREVVLTDFLVVRGQHERALLTARDALTRPLTSVPGQHWNYSALGATLVADILPLDPDLALRLCDKLEREESDTSARRDFQSTFAVLRQQALDRKSGQSEAKTVPPEGTLPPLDFEREFLGQGFRDAIAARRREAVDPRPPP